MEPSVVGSVLLWGAVALALVSSIPRFSKLLGAAALVSGLATLVLGWALLTNDFSMAYVAETSSFATPWPYRLAALWGGMEGSMLFYAAMTTVVAWLGLRRTQAVWIGAAVGFGLLLFTAALANPFERLDIPAVDGEGLLALLQHPAMIYHPPILYLGLTTLVVPFATTARAVATGSLTASWLASTRRALLVSWTLLTIGMVAGANWAYVELGWGGFWAWDPVENTALMPWLAVTVFLHTSSIHRRDGRMSRWSVAFAALPFALTVLGIYLTRSGATGSIHSFAEDPVIGRILLVAAVIMVGVVAALTLRSPQAEPWERFGLGRDTWLAASGGLIAASLVFVAVGSGYPAYVEVFAGDQVSIGSGFFVSTLYPIALAVAFLIGLSFYTSWKRLSISGRDLLILGTVIIGVAVLASALAGRFWALVLLLATAAGALVLLVRSLAGRRPRGRILAGHIAHIGMALVLVGAAGSSLGADFEGVVAPDETVQVGGREVFLEEISTGSADRFIFVRAVFLVDGVRVEPEIRAYEDQPVPIAEPALLTGPGGDVIVAISTVTSDASAVNVEVFVRPMVWWVWAGALTMALAGLAALFGKAGAGAAPRRLAIEEQQSAGRST